MGAKNNDIPSEKVLSELWASVYFHNLPKAFILVWQRKAKLTELPKVKKEPC